MKTIWKILNVVVFITVIYLFFESVRNDNTAHTIMFGACLLHYAIESAKKTIIKAIKKNRKLQSEELLVFTTEIAKNNAEIIKAILVSK